MSVLKEIAKKFRHLIVRITGAIVYYLSCSKGNVNSVEMYSVHSIISHKSNNYFGISLPLIPLDENNKFIFPDKTKRVMIDVGTSFNWPNSVRWLNRHPDDSVVLGFEPDINMWCGPRCAHHFADNLWLLDGGQKTEYFKEEYLDRVFFFPVAIGDFNGHSLYNVNEGHGRSSLLNSYVHKLQFKHLVPVLRLEEIISKIPLDIEYIEHLKIDAQGYDYEVIKSAGESIEKCAVITVELSAEKEYIDSYKSKQFIKYLKSKGFNEIPNSSRYGSQSYINHKYENILSNLDYEIRV